MLTETGTGVDSLVVIAVELYSYICWIFDLIWFRCATYHGAGLVGGRGCVDIRCSEKVERWTVIGSSGCSEGGKGKEERHGV